MRPWQSIVGAALVAASLASVGAAQRPPLLGVYDSRSGAPIQGAIVRDTLGAQALTSADGAVALTYVTAVGPFVMLEIKNCGNSA